MITRLGLILSLGRFLYFRSITLDIFFICRWYPLARDQVTGLRYECYFGNIAFNIIWVWRIKIFFLAAFDKSFVNKDYVEYLQNVFFFFCQRFKSEKFSDKFVIMNHLNFRIARAIYITASECLRYNVFCGLEMLST